MAAEVTFGVLVGGIVLFLAVTQWIDFAGWVRRKGWREPRERIEEGPREASFEEEPDASG